MSMLGCCGLLAAQVANSGSEAVELETIARGGFRGFASEQRLDRAQQKMLRLGGRIALQSEWLGHAAEAQWGSRVESSGKTYTREDALRQRRELSADTNPGNEGVRTQAAGISVQRWQPIGPRNIGARTRALAQHPQQPDTLYMGAASGGIWKTVNAGATWTSIADNLASPEIADIRIDPIAPNRVWAATGEVVYGARGGGIYVTNDAGATWAQRSATAPSSHGGFRWMGRLVLDAANPNRQWLAASGGIYRTADGWANWTRAWPTASYVGDWIAEGFGDVEIDPNNANRLVAAGMRGQIARSNDAGVTWSEVQVVPWVSGYSRVEIAYAPNVANRVYASTIGGAGGRVFVSNDGGATWVERGNSAADVVDPYKNTVWVDPLDGNHVIVGGTTLRRSLDGGITWTQFNNSTENMSSAGFGAILHFDHHIILTDVNYRSGNRRVFAGTDGGVYRLNDVTVSMPVSTSATFANGWVPINGGLSVNQLYAVGAAAGASARAASGAQDQSVAIVGTAGLTPNLAQQPLGGDVMAVAVDPGSNFTYYLYQYMEPARINGFAYSGGEYRICQQMTLSGGQYEGVCAGAGLYQANFRPAMVFDDIAPGGRLLVGGNHLWRSINPREPTHANVAWSRIKSPSAVSGNYIAAIATRPANPNLIWVAHSNGELYRTINGTALNPTWNLMSSPTARGSVVAPTSLYIDPASDDTVYVTYPWFGWQNVWRSANATSASPTWAAVGSGVLPLAPTYAVTRHPTNANWLYVATEVGVFASENGGTTWNTTDDGPRSAPVTGFSWTTEPVLYASTYGRSAWRLDLRDDYVNSAAAANTFATNSTTSAQIETAGDTDFFRFRFPTAGTWTIGTSGTLDTEGQLLAENATTVITASDVGGSGANFQIVHTVDRAATRYVRVNAKSVSTGSYNLVSVFTPAACTLDVDGDGAFSNNDAVLIARHASGFSGAALVNGIAFTSEALRTDAKVLADFMVAQSFNFDGDLTALGSTSDALIASRILRGVVDAAAAQGAVAAGATRTDWASQIKPYVNAQCLTTLP
jgi:hypothetical protein